MSDFSSMTSPAPSIADMQKEVGELRSALRLALLAQVAMFRATDRFGESIAANYQQPLAPIPMDELYAVAGARSMMVGAIGEAQELLCLSRDDIDALLDEGELSQALKDFLGLGADTEEKKNPTSTLDGEGK